MTHYKIRKITKFSSVSLNTSDKDGVAMHDEDVLICNDCGENFKASDFDDIDDEYNERDNLCPVCSEEKQLEHAECDICGEPAEHFIGSAAYCDDHYEEVLDGYISKD